MSRKIKSPIRQQKTELPSTEPRTLSDIINNAVSSAKKRIKSSQLVHRPLVLYYIHDTVVSEDEAINLLSR